LCAVKAKKAKKNKKQKTKKTYLGFHNHSPLLTIALAIAKASSGVLQVRRLQMLAPQRKI